jgi:hypothetical protein
MTTLEMFAVFGVPAILLGIGLTAYLIARYGDRPSQHPGE